MIFIFPKFSTLYIFLYLEKSYFKKPPKSSTGPTLKKCHSERGEKCMPLIPHKPRVESQVHQL